jgi:hypothetical protein
MGTTAMAAEWMQRGRAMLWCRESCGSEVSMGVGEFRGVKFGGGCWESGSTRACSRIPWHFFCTVFPFAVDSGFSHRFFPCGTGRSSFLSGSL